jgi:hypothetical protein
VAVSSIFNYNHITKLKTASIAPVSGSYIINNLQNPIITAGKEESSSNFVIISSITPIYLHTFIPLFILSVATA